MRCNIYSQELITDDDLPRSNSPRVQLVTEKADTGVIYSGVRMYLHSSENLHRPPEDDDRSGVTFWLPKSKGRRDVVAATFRAMADLVQQAPPETGLDD